MVIFIRGKILVLILLFMFLISSGCSGTNTETASKDNNTSAPTAVTAGQKESASSASGEVHIVRLKYPPQYGVVPSELNIKTGDIVSWWSEKRQKPDYTIVSKEGLFPDKDLDYSVPFNYTFSSTGTYLFTVKDQTNMNLTVTVK
jgi:plastocyanin